MDADIERRIRSHDHRGALAALAQDYGEPLGRFCQALLGSPEDGADALQDTLVAALQAMPRYRGDRGLRAWLFGIARLQCAEVIRRRARRRSIWGRVFGAGDRAAEPAPPSEAADARLSLERALGALPAAQREAVLLRYQQGMDATEVADVLGISHPAARKRITIGMQALRSAIGDVTPGPLPGRDTRPFHAPSPATRDEASDEAPHDDHALRTTQGSARLGP
jgi:RNA polymerase sigma-70 factor (ECF subfamily)